MVDTIAFPKTVDEFMEKYKIVDSDEVYTNGTELVPIFRMKQWFEHIEAEPKHGDAIEKIKLIISIPNTVIQEDVLKYKMICEVVERMDEVEE